MRFIAAYLASGILLWCRPSFAATDAQAANTLAIDQQPAVPALVKGEPYDHVRRALIAAGWRPARLKTADPCEAGDVRCANRPEMVSCSDAGIAPCRFLWRKDGYRLTVFTFGMDAEEGQDAAFDQLEVIKEQTTRDLTSPDSAYSTPTDVIWSQALAPCLAHQVGQKGITLVRDDLIAKMIEQVSLASAQTLEGQYESSFERYRDGNYGTEYEIATLTSDSDYLSYYVAEDKSVYICLDVTSRSAPGARWLGIGHDDEAVKSSLGLQGDFNTVRLRSTEGYDSLVLYFSGNVLHRYVLYNTYRD
jgi:hypothetical protein